MRTLFFHICADVLRHASCIGKVMVRAVVGANWGDEVVQPYAKPETTLIFLQPFIESNTRK